MKERPILFSGEMVRAILDGEKTQTRRVVKPQPQRQGHGSDWYWVWEGRNSTAKWTGGRPGACALFHGLLSECPFGVPGDRLWVREAFGLGRRQDVDAAEDWSGPLPNTDPRRRDPLFWGASPPRWVVGYAADGCEGRMRPSIHMPRWASRLTLEITGVRVERLQDITEEDAAAEGVERWKGHQSGAWRNYGRQEFFAEHVSYHMSARESFESLWDGLYAKRGHGWPENPWVWVVEFRRVEGGA